jgi:hypothetical protein
MMYYYSRPSNFEQWDTNLDTEMLKQEYRYGGTVWHSVAQVRSVMPCPAMELLTYYCFNLNVSINFSSYNTATLSESYYI